MSIATAPSFSDTGAYALELRGVGRRFGALTALADIDLLVRAGERRAVLGSNGAGKTTLFNTITGDFQPSTGSIRFFGEDVTSLRHSETGRRRTHRGYAGRARPARRDRPGARGCAALHSLRRTRGRPVADGAARPRRDPDLAARAYRLRHHRARPRRGAPGVRARHDDAQRPHLQGRDARRDRERS